MLNYSGCGDFVLDRLLVDVNERLNSNKLNIISEQKKIKHQENLLSQFRKSLNEQNKNLNIYIEEGDRLDQEIFECTKNKSQTICNNNNNQNNNNNNSNRIVNQGEKIDSKRINLKRKYPDVSYNESRESSIIPSKSSGNISDTKSTLPITEISIKPIELTFLKYASVTTISKAYDFGVFIGGTNGFLMKYVNNKEHIYKPKAKEFIKQIEVMFITRKPIMVAFTKTYAFIFENIMGQSYSKKLFLPGLKTIYNEGSIFYLTMKTGVIKTISKGSWAIRDYRDGKYCRNGIFYPCSISNKFLLLSLKDNLLYKTDQTCLSKPQLVKGVDGNLTILKAPFGFICHSDKVIRMLNKECELTGTYRLNNRVKYVKCTLAHVVVIDCYNFVQIYTLLPEGCFGVEIYKKQMNDVITAMNVKDDTVYIAMGSASGIFTISPFCTLTEKEIQIEEERSKFSGDFNNDDPSKTPSKISNNKELEILHNKDDVKERTSSKSSRGLVYSPVVPPAKMLLEFLEVKNLNNVSVTAILSRHESGVFFGGSDGFLIKFFNGEEHLYDCRVNKRILQIEIMFIDNIPALVAITKNCIIVFEDIMKETPSRKIYLRGINFVFIDETTIYITIENGYIKTLDSSDWNIRDYRKGNYSTEGIFFPCTITNKYLLVSLKDQRLYKTEDKGLSDLQAIEGIEDVRKSLKVNGLGFILYFINVIYFLDEDCNLVAALPIINRVKFIQCTSNYGVVVDRMNVVHVFILLRECNFGDKIFERQIDGVVTAMDANEDQVHLAVHDVVYTVNLK